ncbi:uncharacterized protein BDCG_04358 [Blastomyces dermatitidis ER-3]|uniref:F-box domain-containing protein n=1 Tax=Ajellomyces dermatitidis (strain ER-3 / ATCC MYA-2586) TaxID=559297 RepID=A0ABP2EYD6_AJEDR|nr:uncharacterized protein BDCG_04358 [Blastomyces dermatitidis ER-3]EEQ89238.1 hypothetical protein BDCG_04358 [Blastomyces dermatitidis ER-3]EQL33383.1 hypothetical protein BDFG_04537 [Blastomyces dermatitidis ATCC 26199]
MTSGSSAVAYHTLSPSHQVLLEDDATLKRILLRLRENTSINIFLPCLLVCKKWYSLAIPVLQAAVVLRNHNLCRFVKSARLPLSSKAFTIQSLSLLLDVAAVDPSSTAARAWPLGHLLRDLATIMAGVMRALRIFSLRIDHQPACAVDSGLGDDIDRITAEPSFPASAVIALLESLPDTCSDVEIDTSGCEVYTDGEHLCPHIAKLLPNLTHLRLRIRQLCPSLISIPAQSSCSRCRGELQAPLCPKLRSLVINTELSSAILGWVTRCSPSSETLPAEEKGNHAEEDLQTELSHHLLLGLTSKNCFPAAKRIEIHGPMELDIIPWHHIRQTDIKDRKTYISSFVTLPSYSRGAWKRGTHRCIRPMSTGDGTDAVIISSWQPHPRELTGQNAWISNSEGVSLPKARYPHVLNVFGTDDYHLFPNKDEVGGVEEEGQVSKSHHYHNSLSGYVKEMRKRWKENWAGSAAQARIQTQTQIQTQSHPIYEELCRVTDASYESSLQTQTYHTLRPIPHELFPFPEPVPMEWYRKQTPLGHADFRRVGDGSCCY